MTEFKVFVPAPTRCHIRTALARAQKAWEGPDQDGLLWGARIRED